MGRTTPLAAATVVAAALFLAACGNSDAASNETGGTATFSRQQAETASAPASTPVSEFAAVVGKFTTALDELGIKHTTPTRVEVQMSGAKARFDMTVNGYDAGINIFPNEQALTTWQEASDSLGGIHVALPDKFAALSLNSSEGIANSADIAPRIATAVGGTAHGA